MKIARVAIVVIFSLAVGFAFGQHAASQPSDQKPRRVTGVGGVFFKAKDPAKLKEWYGTHLGFNVGPYGASFESRQADDPSKKATLQWTVMGEKTKYFLPSEKQFMINYRVENLERLLTQLESEGIEPVDKMDAQDYGKFVHIMDPEGNKIELWEPTDKK